MTPASAVVLAAGLSRRMGVPKALLRLDGESLVCRAARVAAAAGADPVVLVVGASAPAGDEPGVLDREQARAALAGLDAAAAARVRMVEGRPREDALASLRAGLRLVPPGSPVLLWPVDCPFADPALTRRLLDAVARAPHAIAVPTCDGRRGHPVAFGAAVVPELGDPRLRAGAREVVERDPARIVCVPVEDRRVCDDADTPEAAARLGLTR